VPELVLLEQLVPELGCSLEYSRVLVALRLAVWIDTLVLEQ
jgi:hypothetical protein